MRLTSISSPVLPTSWQKGEYRVVLVIIGVCCAAALFTALLNGSSFANDLIVNNSIGLSQYSIAMLVRLPFRGRLPWVGLVIAIPAGWLIGSKIAGLLGATDVARLIFQDPAAMRQTIRITILIGVVITAFFLYFSYSRGVSAALERERRRAAEALQAETAAQLALLQAQIEPHFLFNTLANIHSLIKEEPDTASRILEKLDSYLRTSLKRTRNEKTTVQEELDIVEALLSIARERLGSRLEYSISSTPELRARLLPPLLLQPLVENAIRHGIEPAINGGRIEVDVRSDPEQMTLTVTDSGIGLSAHAPEGIGLANVRSRLYSLYADKAALVLRPNEPRGVVAQLIVPL